MHLSHNPLDYPLLILVLTFFAFWISAWGGAYLRKRRRDPEKSDEHEDFALLLGSTLTLLALIIGFTFSMAVNRYDQRKNYEEQEANAIGTEYVRADVLPAEDAAKVRAMLLSYLDQRMLYYKTRNEDQVRQIDLQTASLQSDMWAAVTRPAMEQQTTVMALALAGMNDVLNSQGYTQAAWWNRVPTSAWILLITISIFSNILIGYGARHSSAFRFFILPVALSISLFLIAEIDSPRSGIIRVWPRNLEAVSDSLHRR
jgi:hypothetical protein